MLAMDGDTRQRLLGRSEGMEIGYRVLAIGYWLSGIGYLISAIGLSYLEGKNKRDASGSFAFTAPE